MRAHPTAAEHRLWQILRGKRFAGFKFRRQLPIDHYIADFVCLDQSADRRGRWRRSTPRAQRDARRDAYLDAQGFRVLRFWNNDIFDNEEGVFDAHSRRAARPSPFRRFAAPSLSRKGRGAMEMTMAETYDLIVLGSGPGGYVAAIRAAQLGLKTAIVERAELGGICLNWGCIPTKALLRSAEVLHQMQHAESFGLSAGKVGFDLAKVVARSRDVAAQMNQGVTGLMKRNKIAVHMPARAS